MLACRCIKNFIFLQLLLLIIALRSYSQDYSYINYDTRDGLAGSVLNDAIQDKEGFMWFATENGLSRFDGKNFKTFTTKDGLPDNEILKLFVDSKGRVWIMPFRPSVCYYYKGKIYNKDNDSLLSRISFSSYVFEMTEDKSGNLVAAEEKGWHIIFKDGRTLNRMKSSLWVSALGVDRFQQAKLFADDDSPSGQWLSLIYPVENK